MINTAQGKSKKANIRERLKTAAIVFLTISGIALAAMTGVFDQVVESLPVYSGLDGTTVNGGMAQTSVQPAAWPLAIAVTSEQGGRHYGVKYDKDGILELYGELALSRFMGEAIGSSSEAEVITAAEWEAALAAPGFFWQYDMDIPLSVLAAWLGTEVTSQNTPSVDMLCLALSDSGNMALYYRSRSVFYRGETAVSYSYISSTLDKFLPTEDNSVSFAFELESYNGTDRYALFPDSYSAFMGISGKNPFDEDGNSIDDILSSFEVSQSISDSYTEVNGTVVVVAGNASTLRLTTSGTLTYKVMEEPDTGIAIQTSLSGDMAGLAEAIEGARALLEKAVLPLSGEAELWITGFEEDGSKYTVYFDYYVNGVPVYISGSDWAARVVINDGFIFDATINFVKFADKGSDELIPPELQAAVAQAASGHTGGISLKYIEVKNGVFDLGWISDLKSAI